MNSFPNLNHGLCAWHKYNNIKRIINQVIKDDVERKKYKEAFRKICFSYDNMIVEKAIQEINECKYQELTEYYHKHVETVLEKIAPTKIDFLIWEPM